MDYIASKYARYKYYNTQTMKNCWSFELATAIALCILLVTVFASETAFNVEKLGIAFMVWIVSYIIVRIGMTAA